MRRTPQGIIPAPLQDAEQIWTRSSPAEVPQERVLSYQLLFAKIVFQKTK